MTICRAISTVAGGFAEGDWDLELDSGTKGIADGEADEQLTLAISADYDKILYEVDEVYQHSKESHPHHAWPQTAPTVSVPSPGVMAL